MQWFSSRYDTKLILWTLFIIQLLLIGVFWMLQNLTTNDTDNNNFILGTSSIKKKFINHNNNDDNDNDFRSINFVKQKNYNKFINAVVFRQSGNNNSSSGNKLLSKGDDGEKSKIKNENFFYYSADDSTKQQKIEIKSISNFSEDFITYNKLESDHNNNVENLICYREGTTNILNNNIHYYDTDHIIDNHNDINNLYKNNNINDNNGKCKCKQEWHGKDCGQPEIIWRALMTSKLPLKISDKPKLNPNKIIYMLIGNFLNYELLEIQIMELINIVDFFIICRKNILFNNNNNNKNDNNILMSDTITTNYYYYNRNDDRQNKRLKLNFVPDEYKNRFFIIDNNNNNNYHYEMDNKKINKNNKNNYHLNNCTPKFIYKEFLKNLQNNKNNNLSEETINVIENNNNNNNNNNNMKTLLNPNDIFIFSYDDEILNSKAIKYFKYYDKLPAKIIRFRLKYNVYGFFWQHPENTYLGSYGCNIEQFHNIYKMDPERLFINNNNNNNNNNQKLTTTKNHIIIGDLNHYGGWYCKYCYQPNEIIERLKIDAILLMNSSSSSSSSLSPSLLSIFPKNSKNQQIDVGYIQNLIASGLYVDGKLGLIKLHKYSDKYYTPNYVDKNYWKFNNIITNLYLSYLNDDGDDYM